MTWCLCFLRVIFVYLQLHNIYHNITYLYCCFFVPWQFDIISNPVSTYVFVLLLTFCSTLLIQANLILCFLVPKTRKRCDVAKNKLLFFLTLRKKWDLKTSGFGDSGTLLIRRLQTPSYKRVIENGAGGIGEPHFPLCHHGTSGRP